ncbi:Cytochrome P450 [Dillenia turbinata]|uniref:Cytochrome P450 n=1 Tax=Dillenia turbinata TaxID=194707 RepID=A0AAN8ZQR2_9MAGN
MESLAVSLAFTMCTLIAIHYLLRYTVNPLLHRKAKLPPGPIGLPFFGSLFHVFKQGQPHKTLANLAQEYGPLMTVRLGRTITVVAASPEMAKEILQKHDEATSGRIVPNAVTGQAYYDHSILWISAQHQWRIIRRVLKTSFLNPQKLDHFEGGRCKVVEEMVEFLHEVSKRGEAINIGELVFKTLLNQTSKTCFGVNVAEYKSKVGNDINRVVKDIMELDAKFNIVDFFPWLGPFDPQGIRHNAKVAYDWLHKFCDNFIDARLKHRNANSWRHGDLLDSLLDYSQENESEFNRMHLKILLVDVILGGTETSAETIEWAMHELLLHPDTMSKAREELQAKQGTGMQQGQLRELEALQLPYLQAIIKETLRLHVPIPFLVPHRSECEVKIKDYIIPKDTQILVNAWAMARDPNEWEKPNNFTPERFLGSGLDFKGRDYSYLPFGSGRRMCPGMPLAQRSVGFILGALLLNFEWKLPHGMTGCDADEGVTFGVSLLRNVPLFAIPYNN